MIHWLSENGRTFLWALALSVAVWIAAVTAADPDEERAFTIALEPVGQDSSLVILGELPTEVEVTLRAPRSVWTRLESQETPTTATVDLSGLSAGKHTVNVQVTVKESPARIVSTSPASFDVTLEPLETRAFPVDITINGQPAVGYQAGDVSLSASEVIISGAKSIVDRVARTCGGQSHGHA